MLLRKRISVKPKLDANVAKEKISANEVTPNQNPSPSTTVSVPLTTPAPKNDEAVLEAIQFLTSQKLEPIKSLNLQNKNVKMRELLFVNPPMTKEQKRHKKQNKPKQMNQKPTNNEQQEQSSQSPSKSLASINCDEVEINNDIGNLNGISNNNDSTLHEDEEPSLVPQVKVGPDGKLILDESSTIITRKNLIQEQEAIVEDEDDIISKTDYNSYRQRNKTNKWTTEDTKRFYHGITMFGTDFSMMESFLFSGKRSRTELHKKFKREERFNKIKVDIALNNPISVNSEELDNLKEIL